MVNNICLWCFFYIPWNKTSYHFFV